MVSEENRLDEMHQNVIVDREIVQEKLFVQMEYIVGSNINSRWKRVRY